MKATISQRGFGFVTDNMSLGLTVPYLNISCKNGDTVTVRADKDFVKKLSEDTVDTFFGKGKQHVFLAERDGHGFEWSVTEVEDGLIFGAKYTNNTNERAYLDSFGFETDKDNTISCNGALDTWFVGGGVSLADLPEISQHEYTCRIYTVCQIPLPNPDEYTADRRWRHVKGEFTSLYSSTSPYGLYVAPVGKPVAYTSCIVFADPEQEGGACRIRERINMSNVWVDAGESRDSQEVIVAFGAHKKMSEKVFANLALTHGARINKKTPVGWCSWYDLYANITEESILSTVEGYDRIKDVLPLDVIQIDDGYQIARGDWEWNEKFKSGGASLVSAIRDTGTEAGIWLALTNVEGRAPAFERFYDKIWENSDGALKEREPNYKNKIYRFDMSAPDTLEFVLECLAKKKREGFTYFKLDFNDIFVDGKRSYDGTRTELELFRDVYRAYREVIGEDAYLLACCGGLNRGVFGFADSCRTGTDSGDIWDRKQGFGSCDIVTCINDLNNVQASGSVLTCDPDVTYLTCRLTEDELITWTSYVGLIGGSQFISDALGSTQTAEKLRGFEILSPASAIKGDAMRGELDMWKRRFGFTERRVYGDAGVWMIFNPCDQAATVTADLDALDSIGKRFHVLSFWDGEYLGVKSKDFELTLGAHASRLMRFTPIADGAQFIGTTLHVSMGATEIENVTYTPNSVKITLSPSAGARSGDVFVTSDKAPTSLEYCGINIAEYTYSDGLIRVSLTDRAMGGEQYVTVKF